MASIVRRIFIPEPGQKWLKMDWAQADFRMFGHYLNNEDILKRYRDDPDTDFHQVTADITGLPRSPRFAGDVSAKQMNLASVFGQGAGALANEMGLPCTKEIYKGREFFVPGPEAEAIFAKYHENIPGVKQLQKDVANAAKGRGYVRTIMDRHIHFPNGQFIHKAAGLLFQGSASDCMKIKISEVSQHLEGTDSSLLLSVHDELGISIPDDPKLAKDLAELYCRFDGVLTPVKFRVPMRCEYGMGDNWYEAGL
jgi:DNA polymerase-1